MQKNSRNSMRKNKNNFKFNREIGSRTARLYSKRMAKRITRIYSDEIGDDSENEAYNEREGFDDYFDHIDIKGKKKDSKNKATAAAIAATVIVVIIAGVFVGLSYLRPVEQKLNLAETAEEEPDTTVTSSNASLSAAPEIYGVIPIAIYAGSSVAYKDGVYVVDDTDDNPTLEIENDEVDLTTPGTYTVTYVATDKDGNVTRESTTLTVMEGTETVSEDVIYALADSILESIITDDMTDAQKCLAVYKYLHAINYVDIVHSEDWMQNAYGMLQKREGDCFGYYSAARLLLTRLGYDVMEVRNNNNYVHYWCLVSIDGGSTWWHFDACCWSWGEDGVLCLVSDNYLSTFTRRHLTSDGRLIHAWDKTSYPATPEEDFWTDEDRAVIYEDGEISLEPQHDPDDEVWDNSGWDAYLEGTADYSYYNDNYYYEETTVSDTQWYSPETYAEQDTTYIETTVPTQSEITENNDGAAAEGTNPGFEAYVDPGTEVYE
jgi:hypothetical protein